MKARRGTWIALGLLGVFVAGGLIALLIDAVVDSPETPGPPVVREVPVDGAESNASPELSELARPESPDRTEPSSAEEPFVVRGTVEALSGTAVPGCQVSAVTADFASVLSKAETDEEGAFEIELPWPDERSTYELTLLATCAGYADAQLDLVGERGSDAVVTIQLRGGATIAGRVTLLGREEPPSGEVWVFAWPVEHGAPKHRFVWGIVSGSVPSVRAERVESDGSFELPGLEPGRRYFVDAGGNGYARPGGGFSNRHMARAGDQGVELEVAPLYILAAEFLDSAGGRARTSPRLNAWIAWSPSNAEKVGLEGVSWDSASARASVSPALWSWERAGFRTLFTSEQEAEKLGPFPVTLGLPGYRLVTAELFAHRVRPGAQMTQQITLERTAEGFGSLSVELTAPPAFVGSNAHRQPEDLGKLALKPLAEGDHDRRWLRVPLTPEALQVFDGIPAGSYEARAELPGRNVPLGEVQIESGRDTSLLLDLDGSGSLTVTVWLGDREYRGPVVLDFQPRSEEPSRWMTLLSNAPYTLEGVTPGAYTVVAKLQGVDGKAADEVHIASGLHTDLQLTVH